MVLAFWYESHVVVVRVGLFFNEIPLITCIGLTILGFGKITVFLSDLVVKTQIIPSHIPLLTKGNPTNRVVESGRRWWEQTPLTIVSYSTFVRV